MTNIIGLLDIQMPSNWVDMIIWYGLLVVCLVIFIFSVRRKRGMQRNDILQDRIQSFEEIKASMIGDKALSKRKIYMTIIHLNSIEEYANHTYEESQFVIYNEVALCCKGILEDVKNLNLKKWKEEDSLREEIGKKCDDAINFLKQAL